MPWKSDSDPEYDDNPTRSGSEYGNQIHNTGKVKEEGAKIEMSLPPSDANFDRYGIRPENFAKILNRNTTSC